MSIKLKNLYLVISEPITQHANCCALEPGETYCIACLVVAENPSKAKYSAWESDNYSFTGDPTEMPKMSCNLRYKDCKLPIGVISNDEYEKYDHYWYSGRYRGQAGYIEPFNCDLCGCDLKKRKEYLETVPDYSEVNAETFVLCLGCVDAVKSGEVMR